MMTKMYFFLLQMGNFYKIKLKKDTAQCEYDPI